MITLSIRQILVAVFVAVISYVDYCTGPELECSVIYILPVMLAASMNPPFGLVVAFMSAVMVVLVDISLGRMHTHTAYYVWDFLSRLTMYTLVVVLRSRMVEGLRRESAMARTDSLTGTMNRRAFYEVATRELDAARVSGKPLALAMFDIDDFKWVNDTHGHINGDKLLCLTAHCLLKAVRTSDVVARIGGDEFVVMLPNTHQEAAIRTIERLHAVLGSELMVDKVPVTVSIGAITCLEMPPSVQELIHEADVLMYEVKDTGKNAIKHITRMAAANNEGV